MEKSKNEKISKSMEGNTNAEVYDKEEALKLFNDSIAKSLEVVEEGKEYRYDFIGEVARELGTYHQVYGHLVNRFPELDSLFTELKSNLEANCYFNSKKGHIKEATGIVNLKSNHNWTDRQQIDQNVIAKVHIEPKEFIDDSDTQKV